MERKKAPGGQQRAGHGSANGPLAEEKEEEAAEAGDPGQGEEDRRSLVHGAHRPASAPILATK